MKKFIALLLALMMVLVCVSALATDDPADQQAGGNGGNTTDGGTTNKTNYEKGTEYTLPTSQQVIVIPKVYTVTSTVSGVKLPSDTIKFTQKTKSVTGSTTETTAPDLIGISTVTITENGNGAPVDGKYSYDVEITLPPFTGVGIYTYTLEETDNQIAGVTYIGDIVLKVTVVQDTDPTVTEKKLMVAGIAVRKFANKDVETAATKIDQFENIYQSSSLKVTKKVEGNFGDRSKEFPITITLTSDNTVASTISYSINGGTASTVAPSDWANGSATIKVNLKHNDAVTVDNIPVGVKYAVVEDGENDNGIKHLTAANLEPADPNAYKVDGEIATDKAKDITEVKTYEETITNTKSIVPDTGVTLDSAVYMLIMALAVVGFVALKIRRREDY